MGLAALLSTIVLDSVLSTARYDVVRGQERVTPEKGIPPSRLMLWYSPNAPLGFVLEARPALVPGKWLCYAGVDFAL